MTFWISFYMPTPETMTPMPGAKRVDWRYLTSANPHVIIQWVLLNAANEVDAKDKIVTHYGPGVVWRHKAEVPEDFTPPTHVSLD